MEDEDKKKFETFTDSQAYESRRGQIGSDVSARLLAEEMEAHQEQHGLDTVEEGSAREAWMLEDITPHLPYMGLRPSHRRHWWEREAAGQYDEEELQEVMEPLAELLCQSDSHPGLRGIRVFLSIALSGVPDDGLSYLGVVVADLAASRANMLAMAKSHGLDERSLALTFAMHFGEQLVALSGQRFTSLAEEHSPLFRASLLITAYVLQHQMAHEGVIDADGIMAEMAASAAGSNPFLMEIQRYLGDMTVESREKLLAAMAAFVVTAPSLEWLMAPLRLYVRLTKHRDVDTEHIMRMVI